MAQVKTAHFAEKLQLKTIYAGETGVMDIAVSDINRPGLQLCGHFDYFAFERVQIIGKAEMMYLGGLTEDVLHERLKVYFNYDLPCILIGRGMEPPDCLLEAARKNGVPLFVSESVTGQLIHDVTDYLDAALAPCISRHGGLMDIHGIGVFITGDSGIGKSETMLELVGRGHRLVADDVVEIRKVGNDMLLGCAPQILRYLMEVRGLGLIDISVLYGTGAVMLDKEIELNIHLVTGEITGEERLGLANEKTELLGLEIPMITLPVKAGRNMAVIMEVAARMFRLRMMGHVPGERLDSRILELLK